MCTTDESNDKHQDDNEKASCHRLSECICILCSIGLGQIGLNLLGSGSFWSENFVGVILIRQAVTTQWTLAEASHMRYESKTNLTVVCEVGQSERDNDESESEGCTSVHRPHNTCPFLFMIRNVAWCLAGAPTKMGQTPVFSTEIKTMAHILVLLATHRV